MKRTITKTGSSLVTTIPAAWAKKYGLGKGDEVNVAIDDNRLILTTEKIRPIEEEKVVIDQAYFDPYEERVIGKLYIAGYDLVELTITDPSRIDYLKTKVATHELGFEPIEETNTRIVFNSVVADSEDQYKTFERKAFLTGLETAEITLQALKENNPSKFDEARKHEATNSKFCNYCERHLNKKGTKNHAFTYVLIWALEKIVDEYKYLGDYARESEKPSKETLTLFEEVNQYFRQLYHMYYKFDMKLYSTLAKEKEELIKKGYELITAKQKESAIIMHLMNVTRLVNDCLTTTMGKHAKDIVRK